MAFLHVRRPATGLKIQSPRAWVFGFGFDGEACLGLGRSFSSGSGFAGLEGFFMADVGDGGEGQA